MVLILDCVPSLSSDHEELQTSIIPFPNVLFIYIYSEKCVLSDFRTNIR
jgi:hypothetical protein